MRAARRAWRARAAGGSRSWIDFVAANEYELSPEGAAAKALATLAGAHCLANHRGRGMPISEWGAGTDRAYETGWACDACCDEHGPGDRGFRCLSCGLDLCPSCETLRKP